MRKEIHISQTAISIKQQKYDVGVARADMKLEVALIPVSDVGRAKEFYKRLGWRLDRDIVMGNDFRLVQFTPRVQGARSRSARESRRPRLAGSEIR